MTEFTIDPALEEFLPHTSDLETELLEEALLAHGGARDPLIVWDEQNLLVDGHRRYAICTRLDLPYKVERRSFPSRQAVEEWMLLHQLSRRNLLDHDRAQLTSKLIKHYREKKGGEAAMKVAEVTRKSKRTVYRQNAYAETFEKLIPEWQEAIKSGEVTRMQKYVAPLSSLSKREQRALYRETVERGDTGALLAKFPDARAATKPKPRSEPKPKPDVDDSWPFEDSGDTAHDTVAEDDDTDDCAEFCDTVSRDEDGSDSSTATMSRANRGTVSQSSTPSIPALVDEAIRSSGAFARSVDRLFRALDGGTGWKRRIDNSLRYISQTLEEVKEHHG